VINSTSPRKVLLVDDDKGVLALFKKILEVNGFSVAAASGGRAAAKLHSELGGVDLLITDIEMPDQTGFELADALSAKQPNLPVLFMTRGLPSEGTLTGFPQRNILQKPFTARTLLASVDKMLSNN